MLSLNDLTKLVAKRERGHVVRISKKNATHLIITDIPRDVFAQMQKQRGVVYTCKVEDDSKFYVSIPISAPCSIVFPMSHNNENGYTHDFRLCIERDAGKIVATVSRYRYYAPRPEGPQASA